MITDDNFLCPEPAVVSQNVNKGKWTEGYINWWVESASRPLYDNEPIKNLFRILFESSTVACHYKFGNAQENTWLIIKGNSPEKKLHIIQNDGWEACQNKECEFSCGANKLSACHFTFN